MRPAPLPAGPRPAARSGTPGRRTWRGAPGAAAATVAGALGLALPPMWAVMPAAALAAGSPPVASTATTASTASTASTAEPAGTAAAAEGAWPATAATGPDPDAPAGRSASGGTGGRGDSGDSGGIGGSASSGPALSGGGEWRLLWNDGAANRDGVLARAHPLLGRPGVGAAPAAAVAELGWHGRAAGTAAAWRWHLDGDVLGRLQAASGSAQVLTDGRVNTLAASVEAGAWALSAGKQVVSWDVGHGFRPNDVVQQAPRRALLESALEGRPLLMAERFSADAALALVWVNPQRAGEPADQARGGREPALALRAFRQAGPVDWHGVARWGAHTGSSAGLAISAVPGTAWSWHGSLRLLQRHDGWDDGGLGATATLAAANPWQRRTRGGTTQALLGLQWTGDRHQSLLLEAWHDGSAPSDAQWRAWGQRNAALLEGGQAALAAAAAGSPGAPPAAWGGNLAWQATPWDGANLRQDNLFAHLAWQGAPWSASLDLLVQPADRGRSLTAQLQWQGDRWRLLAAWRQTGGPADALLRQLPQRGTGLLAAVWAF